MRLGSSGLGAMLGWGALLVLPVVVGCGESADQGPPEVRYGESVCNECGMILSDERYAAATIVDGDRGSEPRLFDDFNCQANHERRNPTLQVLARWVHDHETRAWIPAGSAHYVRSASLQTPMASGVAAFAARPAAQAFAATVRGEVIGFDAVYGAE